MANLKPPGNKSDISAVDAHVLMRLRVQSRPAVGFLTGAIGTKRVLCFVSDNEALQTIELGLYGLKVEFIDYLLENESMTIFGSTSERNDETDLGPEPDLRPIRIPAWDDVDFSGIPDWVPFWVHNQRRGPMWVVMAQSRERPNERIALYVGRNSQYPMGSRRECDMGADGDRFRSMDDLTELKRFKTHDCLRETTNSPF